MTFTQKRIFMVLLGGLAACMVWPWLLLVQHNQHWFTGYFSFSITQGLIFGLLFGAVFGSFEGIVISSRPKAFWGLLFGAATGLVAGAVGVSSGQGVLFAIAESFSKEGQPIPPYGLVIARASGWAIIGIIVAMIEGFRSRSFRKLIVGLAGGFCGGIAGALVMESILFYFPGKQFALLGALTLFGLLLSFFYSFFERRFTMGSIKILNGSLKNREYSIVKSQMSIGSSDSCDIVVSGPGYRGIKALHAWIIARKAKIILLPAESVATVLVNDSLEKETVLRREDVFAIGNAKFIYGIFR